MSDTSSPREPKLSNESERTSVYADEDLNLANYQNCWDKLHRHTIRQIEQIKEIERIAFFGIPPQEDQRD
ncbi:hypothetical protein PVAR5_4339 [Paecilomyces variotii No. 5]|uniref:Uncharacterized protein n=1 Tax=Byssochlamys spectabilis (strain No. 5 / NBRC 109023) TaxID=1356009 RepID=V5FUE8_BYSSN|nr:hypothetical protein PVAR5_4339 [Paecilomyces variotii No. 5]